MTNDLPIAEYTELRDAILEFVESHPSPDVAPFKAAVAGWGSEWCGGVPSLLPAARFLSETRSSAGPDTEGMVALFEKHGELLKWEQSYTRADAVVGDDMLNGYGFVEVIGKNGPFVSTRVRSGIGVWGPNIDYPVHNHKAEEIYVPLAGSADFTLDDSPYETRRAGDVVHVSSNLRHGFRTTDSPFVVFYVWKDGDLRQKSTF